MIPNKPVKISMNIARLVEVIVDIFVKYHRLPNFIMGDKNALFTSKFCLSLKYFLDIKKKISIIFY